MRRKSNRGMHNAQLDRALLNSGTSRIDHAGEGGHGARMSHRFAPWLYA
jgi:hypothetical protein